MERAYVTQILDPHHVVVRIPTLNKYDKASGATPDHELSTAIVAAPSGTHVEFSVGDAVLVDFEVEDLSKPVIVGSLFNQKTKNQQNVFEVNQLKVGAESTLPENTSIGEVSKDSIRLLRGLELDEAETLQSRLDAVKDTQETHTKNISENKQGIEEAKESISRTSDAVSSYTSILAGGSLDVAVKFNSTPGYVTIGEVALNPQDYTESSNLTMPPYTLNGLANSIQNIVNAIVKSMQNTVEYVDDVKVNVQNHSHTLKSVKDVLIKDKAAFDQGEGDLIQKINNDKGLQATSNGALLFLYTK